MEKNTEVKEIIRMRNHFSSVFEQIWGFLLVLVAMMFSNEEAFKLAVELFTKGKFLQALLALGGTFVVFLVVLALYVNRWYRTTITVKDGVFTIEQLTLNRKVNNIAVQNISNINLEQNLFEMVMGTYKLKLDTDSMSTASETDVQIILKKDRAYEVKNLVISMMKEQEAQRNAALGESANNSMSNIDIMDDREEFSYKIVYNTKEIVKNCIINTSILLVILSIAMLACSIVGVVEVVKEGKGFLQIIISVMGQGAVFLAFVSIIVNGWLNDFRFRATRQSDKIYVSCGLLKRKKYAIPLDRINAVVLRYSFVGRLLNRPKVELLNVGGQGQDAGGKTILLSASYEKQKEYLKILLPEYDLPEFRTIPKQPKRCLTKNLISSVVLYSIILIAFLIGVNVIDASIIHMKYFSLIVTVVMACIILFTIILSVSQYRASGLMADNDYLVISNGMFGKSITFITYNKIQNLRFFSGPIERRLQLTHGVVFILACNILFIL